MRILYPLLWSRLTRQASWEQAANTIAALARRGHNVTALAPGGRNDPPLAPQQLRDWFAIDGDFRLIQRASRWAGENFAPSVLWLRQVFRDPELARADLLYSRIPAMIALGGLCPIPFVTDHYRPWPDDLPAIRPLIRRTARHPRSLGLILHSEYAADAYRRIGIAEPGLLVAHNGAPTRADDAPEKAEARAILGLPADRPTIVYAGRINAEKGLDRLLEVAALRPDPLFLLVGSEGHGPIEAAATARENLRILPWASPAELPLWLAAADVLVIPPSRAPLDRFRNCVLPMKLYAYLAAARPILAPEAPDTAELLRHEDNALLVPPDDPEVAATALDRLLGDPALAARLAGNARLLSDQLTWDARAARIGAFLEARLLAAKDPTL